LQCFFGGNYFARIPHSQKSLDHRDVGWQRDHLRSSIMTRTSERQSLTREEKFVALVHLYAELRLPFAAALDAAEADLLHEQNKGPKETARRSGMNPDERQC
jgi:hypothetical protein